MRKLKHFTADSIEDAIEVLQRFEGRAKVNAGGTDLLGVLKDEVLPCYPEAVIDLKKISEINKIRIEEEAIVIGALVKIADIAKNPAIQKDFTALAQAARHVGSPQIREMGTIGGNICQDIRCWYYRSQNNRFPCLRKGGGKCYAWDGDNRYHSIFGSIYENGCIAVHPSDLAPALIALNAEVVTTKRVVPAEDFFEVGVCKANVLDYDEIVLEIIMPKQSGTSAYKKYALRKSIDFSIVNCAVSVHESTPIISDARICLSAVYLVPYRARKAEEIIIGSKLTKQVAESAGKAAVIEATPRAGNEYKVQIAKILVERTVLKCIPNEQTKKNR